MEFYIVLCIVSILYSVANARGIPDQAEFMIPQDVDQQQQTTTGYSHSSKTRKIKAMMDGWQQLSDEERLEFKNFVDDLTSEQDRIIMDTDDQVSATSSNEVFQSLDLYSYYSYLYYYPTMEWSLDKTPETDDYWVGIYKVGTSDRDYFTHQWLKKTAQGSYKIGKLGNTAGEESTDRREEYELRIFKGDYQRLDAVSNRLHGVVHSPPINVPSDASTAYMEEKAAREAIHPKLKSFLKSLKEAVETKASTSSTLTRLNIQDLWLEFDKQEQDLLYPILEQDCLPLHIREPDSKPFAPEPLEVYPNLPDSVAFAASTDPARVPDKITLTITLDHSYTYVYPVLNTKTALSGSHNWLGVYRARATLPYPNTGYLGWQWVGPGYNKKTYLSKIIEEKEGPINQEYAGPVFDTSGGSQIGFASDIIQATISDTPAEPRPKFDPIFNAYEGLVFAKLSDLAYKDYDTVKTGVSEFDLEAVYRIYDQDSDTNGFIASNDTTIVIAFRGTASFTNAVTDLSFSRKKITSTSSEYAHGGFVDAENSVYGSIESHIQSNLGSKRLIITGHSLGGALASLFAYRISLTHRDSEPILYVYGCPPVGDADFSAYFKGMPSYVITIEGDPVSTGSLTTIGPWLGLYKPMEEFYLPKAAGHGIADYIEQLEKLQQKKLMNELNFA